MSLIYRLLTFYLYKHRMDIISKKPNRKTSVNLDRKNQIHQSLSKYWYFVLFVYWLRSNYEPILCFGGEYYYRTSPANS
jgi:hypothetical protein